jgi:V/A-type H+/Na+-transporting ATPase subunit D
MIPSDIKATRAELQTVRKRIILANQGHRLLKLKRDVLILELVTLARSARETRFRLDAANRDAGTTLAIAQMMEGSTGVLVVALSVEEVPEIVPGSRNIMGLILPVFTPNGVRKDLAVRGYGLIGTSSVIDEAAEAFEELTELVIRHGEQVATINLLVGEITRLKRRVNALEFRVIPDLIATRDAIILRRDEMEREELSRIFWVKKRR